MATNAVTGVQIMDTAHQCQTLSADFVVDAMGRHSRTMMWLAELGYPEPPETVINPFMGYATRWYHLPEGVLLDVPAVLIQPGSQPGLYRGAAAGLLEKRRVVVTLLGMNQDYPPTDEAGFAAFAHGLPDDTIARWLSILEPVTPIFGYRATNRLRHMEQVSHYPERLMLLGDATIALNPIYGQGMTVAALHAELLQHLLQQGSTLDGLARHFHRRLAHTNRIPWLLATGEDRRYPLTEGPKPNLLERLAHQYIDLLFRAAARDTVVAVALLKTMQMIQHPMGLLHPRIILGALLAQRASGKSQSTPDSQWHQAAD
jgi:2-polyprenyl-6-methoxyphenol hydroxylase-like FAD-dependent oxidoreductase